MTTRRQAQAVAQEARAQQEANQKHQKALDASLMEYISTMLAAAEESSELGSTIKDSVHFHMLLSMVKQPSLEVSAKAVEILYEICNTEGVPEAIVSSGSLPSLVHLLDAKDVDCAYTVAELFSDMSVSTGYGDVRTAIIDAGAVAPAVALLASESSEVRAGRAAVANLLHRLVFRSSKGKIALLEAGGISPLFACVMDNRHAANTALTALCNVSTERQHQAAVFEKMTVPALEHLLSIYSASDTASMLVRLLANAAADAFKEEGDDTLKAAKLLASLGPHGHGVTDHGITESVAQAARARLQVLEKRASLGLDALPTPHEFLCPITMSVMKDPVVASDGHSYERSAIERLLQRAQRVSPMTRATLERNVFPNINLKKRITDFEADVVRAAETSRAALGAQGANKRARRS